jgi:hypothetical protein
MSPSAEIDVICAEIETADYATAMEGGGAMLAYIGSKILKRIGYEPDGKANVKFEIDEQTVITITWACKAET